MKNLNIIQNKIKQKILPLAEQCINNFFDYGNLYYVGGCIRNDLINIMHKKNVPIKDIDLATNLEPNILKEILNKNGYKTIDTGIEHGTFTLLLPIGENTNKPIEIEITTFRKDVSTDGRRRTIQYSRTIEEDLERRDFTANAIAKNVKNDEIIDPFNGIKDIENMNLNFVLDTKNRIKEDNLRVLRYFRFIFQLEFNYDIETIEIIKKNFDISLLSNERIISELDKILLNLNKNNFHLLNILFDDKILFSNILIKELFNNFIEEKNNILKVKNKNKNVLYSFSNFDGKIFKKLHFSNNDIKEIEKYTFIKNFLKQNKNINEKLVRLFLFKNNINLETFENYNLSVNNKEILNIINYIKNNNKIYNQKNLNMNGNDVEAFFNNKIDIKDKKIIGEIIENSVEYVILNDSEKVDLNKKDLLLNNIKNMTSLFKNYEKSYLLMN